MADTTAKHTPGPYYRHEESPNLIRAMASDLVLARMDDGARADGEPELSPAEIEANALLFTAAPDTAAERDRLRAENKKFRDALEIIAGSGSADDVAQAHSYCALLASETLRKNPALAPPKPDTGKDAA